MTITIGWWALPFVLTCAAFLDAYMAEDKNQRGMMAGLDGIIFGALALIVSLIAWLIWAVLT